MFIDVFFTPKLSTTNLKLIGRVTEEVKIITRCSFPHSALSRMLYLRHLLEVYNNSQCSLASTVHGECVAPSSEDETLGCPDLQE